MKHLLVFAKAPIPGKVKTRLQPFLSGEEAADLMCGLTDAVLSLGDRVADRLYLACATDQDHPFFREMSSRHGCELLLQPDGDLGARMQALAGTVLKGPDDRAVLLGADSPTLPLGILHDAFRALEEFPVVLGPALDGGYYLLGLRAPVADDILFTGKSWGTEEVFVQTLAGLRRAELKHLILPFWYDVDTVAGLHFLWEHWRYLHAGRLAESRLGEVLGNLAHAGKLA